MFKMPNFWHHHHTQRYKFLRPLSWIWESAQFLRMCFSEPRKLSVPVICIGNVTFGGAGKTPVCLALAELLQKKGACPHFLSRGYKGQKKGCHRVNPHKDTAKVVGDEALLLAQKAPTWVGKKRWITGQEAIKKGATHLILDDGFQNASLHKDLSLLVVNGTYGFGNGEIFPAGPLRESLDAALERAQGVFILEKDQRGILSYVRTQKRTLPIFSSQVIPHFPKQLRPKDRVLAFAGIAYPEKFFNLLRTHRYRVIETVSFPDHGRITEGFITRAQKKAYTARAKIVTTEKDYVRLPKTCQASVIPVPIEVPLPDAFCQWIDKMLSSLPIKT